MHRETLALSCLTQPLECFLEDLAARKPTPGGGSASALGGALGAALASMAAVFTTGNEKFASVEDKARDLDARFARLRAAFSRLIGEDIAAYDAWCAARALPKTSAEEKQARSAQMKAAGALAIDVPQSIVEAGLEGLALVEELAVVVNPNLAGDVSVAAYFLETAVRGAGIQVVSNSAAADTTGENARRREAVSKKIAQCQASRERVDQAVMKLLKL
jgi:formiminotetrahydrofolate cyclodeaminase